MKTVSSLPKTTFGGRRFTRRQLLRIQETVQAFTNLSRRELALTVCEHLDWKTPRGSLKIQSALTLLEALEAHGVIALPPKRAKKARTQRVPTFDVHPPNPPVEGPLASVAPISLRPVTTQEDRERWKAYLQTYHYLGYKHPFGASMGYFIVSEPRQLELGCFVFTASASWALAPRDQWIGWDKKHREKLLSWILSNDRFLIFPWVKVPHLASHALSLATNRIADDWMRVHGYRPVLIETFVDSSRFSGTCYQAANWQHLGQTRGRGRKDARHKDPETKKDIYAIALQSDWRECLTQGHRKIDIKKRYRNDLASSRTRSVGDAFVALWENVVEILHEVAAEYDEKWRVRRRVIDSLMLVLLIFRLVSSKNSQSYGTTIDDLWDSCDRLDLSLPQKSSIAPSSFCAARKKLDESIFQIANRRILAAYAPESSQYTWRGHRLFAVDTSKINLPPRLVDWGYKTPNQQAHYPQGMVSCLYEIRSGLPFDFDLVSHADERRCAHQHLDVLGDNDVVVYDRGYLSYPLLHQHCRNGIHAIFRLQEKSSSVMRAFFRSPAVTDTVVTILPSQRAQEDLGKKHPNLDIVPLRMRLLKYEISGNTFCLGTTLVDPQHAYPLQDFVDVYHSRWGIEELYKVSKRVLVIEDFHAKTERGVKQELFAHFVLITMNRLFANRADLELNESDANSPSRESAETGPSAAPISRIQTNFKNCIHVFQRSLEELLLLESRMKTAVQRAFDAIVHRYQRVRPGRSFPRRSLRPDPRWSLSKEKRRERRRSLAAVAAG